MHHLNDSTILDFPQPFGPTIPVKPFSIRKVVLSKKDLNPDISNFLKKIFLQYNLEKFSVNISVNHKIININQPYNIKNGDEIAILPPFAGG